MRFEEPDITKILFNTEGNMEALIYPMYVVRETRHNRSSV